MKRIIFFLVFVLIFGSAMFFLREMNLKDVFSEIIKQQIYIQRDEDGTFMSDWTEEDVLNKVNAAREEKGLSKLVNNAKLDQSAKARLSVVLSENDVDGSITGISREKAISNAGYSANLIGDLVILSFFKTNDLIAYWSNNEITNNTLFHRDFRDIGIAIKNSPSKVDVYLLLASPRKIVAPVSNQKVTWGGIELWNAVNKRRVEMGVNPLKQKEELCTIASIRLNQLLELGKLDGHAGFVPVLNREDLKWISEKYNISEFLIQGYQTPDEAVKAWENTMGHKILLSGGEYVWGCVYAQNTFGVAIAAY